MRRIRNGICRVLALSILLFPLRSADAELIRIDSGPALVQSLEKLGVTRQEAAARVAAMTVEERAALSAHIDSMPAGGNVGYEIVFAATGIAIVVGLVVLVWILVKTAPAGD